MRLYSTIAAIALAWLSGLAPASAGRQIALLVGVQEYDKPIDSALTQPDALPNAVRDVKSIKRTLEADLKFTQVEVFVDEAGSATQHTSYAVVRNAWRRILRDLQSDDTILFYFAGHAVETRGNNYLLSRDSKFSPSDITLLDQSALSLQTMMAELGAIQETKKSVVGIFIVDACRDNPFYKNANAQGIVGPIGPVRPPKQVFVMYSAGIGQQALDGRDGDVNSVFMKHFLALLDRNRADKSFSLADLAQRVRFDVYAEAMLRAHPQTPAYYDQLLESRNIRGEAVAPGRITVDDNTKQKIPFQTLIDLTSVIECLYCPELVILPSKPDGFDMGSEPGDPKLPANEKPRHRVAVPARFAMSKFEITNRQWDSCVDLGKGAFCKGSKRTNRSSGVFDRLPATNVSWDDAQDFAKWLSSVTGGTYRLPTEAEWEYAARGGETKPSNFSFGEYGGRQVADTQENLCLYANGADRATGMLVSVNLSCDDKTGAEPALVGSYRPNRYFLHDLRGNAWEWTLDCWHDGYANAPKAANGLRDGSKAWAEPNCARRVVRGGSWRSGPDALRTTARNAFAFNHRRGTIGFRVVREIKPEE
ncbi:MAG: SUMF1/EgtB/PvdO family nonheme iron enzyme [Hyphomicrobiaceae bacterium]